MDRRKTCCVTGHRDIPEQKKETIAQLLPQEILKAIADGYTHFISGFATGADLMFADIMIQLKAVYPITLEIRIKPDFLLSKFGREVIFVYPSQSSKR